MKTFLLAGLIGLAVLVLAACGPGDSEPIGPLPHTVAAEPEATPASEAAAQPEATQAPEAAAAPEATQSPVAVATTTGKKFKFQLVSVNRALNTFGLMEDFAKRVSDRTNGQVAIELTSYPELGISGFDSLRTLRDGSKPFSEIYSGFARGDFPLLELGELIGLFPDADTQLRVLKALEEDEARVVRDRFSGEIIAYNYYPNQYFFSKRPLNSRGDFEGMRTRTLSGPLGDLIAGLGAQPQAMALGEVYTALKGDILDAGITASTPGYGNRWYQVTDYVVGPIEARPHTLITMNTKKWSQLPADFQQIIKEEGKRHMEENLRLAPGWDQGGVDQVVAEGMTFSEFSPEVRDAIRQAVVATIVPDWVKRAGGPGSEAVQIFNAKVAPIVGMVVNADGTVSETPNY